MKKCSSLISSEKSLEKIDIIRISKSNFNKNVHYYTHQIEYTREEYLKEACNFLISIPLNEKQEKVMNQKMIRINKRNSRSIDNVIDDLYHYKKEDLIKDAESYLSNLPTITEKYKKLRHHRQRIERSADYFFDEFEEEYRLRVIKLDEKKTSYIHHLETPMIYNFKPILDHDEDISNLESIDNMERKMSTNKLDSKSDIINNFPSLRKMKNKIFSVCPILKVEYGLACYAWVYFEYLINKGIVNTKNKYLILSICFLLALKFYDIDDGNTLKNFYDIISKIFRNEVKRKDILENEIKIYAALNFSLIAPLELINIQLDYLKKLKPIITKSIISSET